MSRAACFPVSSRANGPDVGLVPQLALAAGWYKRPSYTYGPYNLGENSSLSPYAPRSYDTSTQNDVASLTLDYQAGEYALKSVTSYLHDRTVGLTDEGYDILRTQPTLENPGRTGLPLWAGNLQYAGVFDAKNERSGIEQEFRLSSPAEKRFSFVAGVFISSVQTKYDWQVKGNYNADYLLFDGLTASQRYAGQNFATPGVMSELHATTTDTETALLGEGNYKVTDKLKLTLGLRISQTNFHFQQANYGFYNVGRNFLTSPGAYIDGTIKSTPVTPKVNVQYDFTSDKMAYFTVAKGYRSGGLNSPLNPACAPGLAIYGLTVNDIPTVYNQDSVVSYELGTKLRLLDNKMQLNAAAFQIDWSNIQVAQTVTGCPGWQQNGGTATSKGVDLQVDYRPVSGWLVSLSAGYDKANYTQNVLGPVGNGQAVIAFNAGDPIAVPNIQGTLGVRYDFALSDQPVFIRADWNFVGRYQQGSSFGAVNYSPSTRNIPASNILNLRAGVTFGKVDLTAYSTNVLGSRQLTANLFGNGQASCTTAGSPACTAYGTFNPFVQEQYQRPRVIGMQASYRF